MRFTEADDPIEGRLSSLQSFSIMTSLTVKHVRGLEGLRSVKEPWLEFAKSLGHIEFYHHYYFFESFLIAWQNRDAYIFLFYQDNALVAILPFRRLTLKCFGIHIPALEIPWDYDFPINDILIGSCSPVLFSTMFNYLNRINLPCHAMRAKFTYSDSHFLRGADEYEANQCVRIARNISDYLSRKELDDTRANSKKKSRSVHRKLKKLERLGKLEFCVYDTPDALETAYQELLSIEASGWKGRSQTATIYYDESTVFFAKLIESFAPLGSCAIYSLKLNNKTIAAKLCITMNGNCYFLKIGYDEYYAKMSPGVLLIENAITQLSGCGVVREYNFVTHHDYYQQWNPKHRTRYEAYVFKPSVLGLLGKQWFRAKKFVTEENI